MNGNDHFVESNAKLLGKTTLPHMPYGDRLKVADVIVRKYADVMAVEEVPFPHYEYARTAFSLEFRRLAEAGEQWAAQAFAVYRCRICSDRGPFVEEPGLHRRMCAVTSAADPSGGGLFHRALSVQHEGGTPDLNVYVGKCGATNLIKSGVARKLCEPCFSWW